MELLRQLWRGNISLARTFWLYYFGVAILFKVGDKILTDGLFSSMTVLDYLIIYLIIGIQVIYFVFILIAVWRSATKYKGSVVWAALAKLGVIIGTINLISQIQSVIYAEPYR